MSLRTWRGGKREAVSWTTVAITAAGLVLVIAFVVVCVGSMSGQDARRPGFAAADAVPAGDVTLSLATFADGRAHFYRSVTRSGGETRFFVVKSDDGVVRTALDACDSCYRQRKGFRQTGDHMICIACGRSISLRQINAAAGECNPAALEHMIEGDRIIIKTAAVEPGRRYFQ